MRWFRRTAQAMDEVLVRVTDRNGVGLMNNQALDRMRLSDDEDEELLTLMDYGLQQPRGVPAGAVFFFTEDGFARPSRLVRLLRKASTNGYVERRVRYVGTPLWRSTDGQVAISPEDFSKSNPVPLPEPRSR